jgi:hypothetical protein
VREKHKQGVVASAAPDQAPGRAPFEEGAGAARRAREREAIPAGVVIRMGVTLRDDAKRQFRRDPERARAVFDHRGW